MQGTEATKRSGVGVLHRRNPGSLRLPPEFTSVVGYRIYT
jgi:hypothetical protein